MDAEIARKLRVREPSELRALHVPEGLANALPGREGQGRVVLCFVGSRAEVAAGFARAKEALAPGGALWMAYPKKSARTGSDLDRDHGWEPLSEAGWAGVSQIALDATWSALRFKHDPALLAARDARGAERAPAAKTAPKPSKPSKR